MAKFPKISVKTPTNSNIFILVGAVVKEMKSAEVSPEYIDEFRVEVMSCAPSIVLTTCKKWVVMTA